jgi:AsmA protein
LGLRLPKAIGFKRLGIAIGVVVAIALAAVALPSYLISADAARDAVKAQIKAATGLDPVVRGQVAVSLFPPDTVTLGDVLLGDDRNRPALAAQVLTARLRLLPLLMGRIEIADVVLVRPRISVLMKPQSGQSNWSPLVDGLARALQPDADRGALSFSEIHINDGTIVYEDAEHNMREALHHVELSLAWPAISKSFAATGQFAWRNEVVDAAINVSDFYAALTGDESGLKFRLTSTPLKVAFDGSMSKKPTLKVDGTISADATRLRDALRWVGKSAPPGGGFNRFTLKAQVNASASTFGLSAVNLELDGNAAEGVLSYSMSRPSLQGTLAANAIDLTPYISTFHLLAANAREWNNAPLTVDGLATTDLDLRMSAARVTMGSAKLGRTAVAANLRNGRLMITVGESQAYDGIVTGSFTIAKSGAGAELKSQMQFTDVTLESCLGQLFGVHRLEGKGNLVFALDASGNSIDALARTLAGDATLTATSGSISGLNVEQLLKRLERRPLSGTGDFRSGRTPYDKLNVGIKVVNGVATAQDVRLEGAAVRLALGGTFSIPARDLDLQGTATLVATAADPGFELPFMVQGPWEEPIILPDPQALIRRSGAAAPLLNAVQDRKARDAVRSAIDKLTRGTSQPARQEAGP